MELIIKPTQTIEAIEFNYEELKAWIEEKKDYYMSLVYTEDNIADLKKDKAEINKFIKTINEARIKKKKEILQPYEEFEKKVKELEAIIGEPLQIMDKKAKEYEEQRKAEKQEKIRTIWESIEERPDWLKCSMIWDKKWLNASTSLKSIEGDLRQHVQVINTAVKWISEKPYAADALEVYKNTLDIQAAMSEGERLYNYGQKVKQELEAQAPEQTDVSVSTEEQVDTVEQIRELIPDVVVVDEQEEDPEIFEVEFSCSITAAQAKALREFCDQIGIKLQPARRD